MCAFQQARAELGTRLRHLRESARLSGKELAARLSWQASKVSRIENARQTVTEGDVVSWGQAVEAAPDVIDELAAQAVGLLERHDSWRQRHKCGPATFQEDVRELESRTKLFRVFEPGLVIGLLQTAEYARNIFCRVRRAGADIDAAIGVRMRRQEILYDPARRFRFLLPEAALRYRLAPEEVMRGQLDRLLAITTLPNVEFGVIPFASELPSAPLNGFWIYNESMVGVPTRTKDLLLRDPDDIAFYANAFEELWTVAAFGEEARTVIMRVLADFAGQASR